MVLSSLRWRMLNASHIRIIIYKPLAVWLRAVLRRRAVAPALFLAALTFACDSPGSGEVVPTVTGIAPRPTSHGL